MSRSVQLLHGSGADPNEVGGKAAALDRLIAWQFPVPPCAVLRASVFRSMLRHPRLAALVAELSGAPIQRADEAERAVRRIEDAFFDLDLPAVVEAELAGVGAQVAAGGSLAV